VGPGLDLFEDFDVIENNPFFQLYSYEHTNDPKVIARHDAMLAVNGAAPMAVFPGIDTYRSQGFALDVRNWWGVVGSARAPKDHINRLSRDIVTVISDPEYRRSRDRARWLSLGTILALVVILVLMIARPGL